MSKARERTILHMQRLVAAATVVSAGVSACKKDPAAEGGTKEAKPDDAGNMLATDALSQAMPAEDASRGSNPDPDAVAPSTLDSATFVEAGATTKTAKPDAGKWRATPHPTGYAVVDPMPPPTRLPPTLDGGRRRGPSDLE